MATTKAEALAWLQQEPDATGECDRCSRQNVSLWVLPAAIDSGVITGWMFCSRCFTAIVFKSKELK